MSHFGAIFNLTWTLFLFRVVTGQSKSYHNPTIIQDSRLEPNVDGTFGFLYRTEDGIQHAAKGDPNGFIQGSYSYKDPTGLKVNFNYFAGARHNAPGSSPASKPQSQYSLSSNEPEPSYSQPQGQSEYYNIREPEPYREAQSQYIPRTRPPALYTGRTSPDYQPTYQPRYTSRSPIGQNEIFDDDYQYRG